MARADTIQQPRWRVQVFSPLGEVTHESTFKSLERAEEYYGTVCIAKSVKRLEVRAAGARRFVVIRSETMARTDYERLMLPHHEGCPCSGCKP